MDKKELQKNIALYYSKLPPEAQKKFSSMAWLETLKNISANYGLNAEQQETLGTETTLVLLGIIHVVEYEENLRKEIALPSQALDKILSEVNASVFGNIRSQLIETFHKNDSALAPEENIEGKLDERFEKLPGDIRNAIDQSNYQTVLYAISKENNFTVEQMGIFEEELVDTMLGRTSKDQFRESLKNKLRLDNEKAEELITIVNEKILKGIREKMGAPKIESAPKINKEELNVLNNAGIKILGQPDLTKPELSAPTPKPQNVSVPPILAQKFTGSFKIPTTKTEHAPENTPKVTIPPTKAYTKGGDPYRLPPE